MGKLYHSPNNNVIHVGAKALPRITKEESISQMHEQNNKPNKLDLLVGTLIIKIALYYTKLCSRGSSVNYAIERNVHFSVCK